MSREDHPPSDMRVRALVDMWCRDYSARTGLNLHEVEQNGFTYVYDIESGRPVCVYGRSRSPSATRDTTRQRGTPLARTTDDRGHIIAHSMGGGMDINMIGQDRTINRGSDWRAIERRAAANPGTPVAVRLRYQGNADRPSRIDYAYEDADGLTVARFDNDRGLKIHERHTPPESRHIKVPTKRAGPSRDERSRS